jgi:type IV secretion system protein TrbE
MMNLAEHRNKNARLADFPPWVALVGQGTVPNKDGSFQRTARFRASIIRPAESCSSGMSS